MIRCSDLDRGIFWQEYRILQGGLMIRCPYFGRREILDLKIIGHLEPCANTSRISLFLKEKIWGASLQHLIIYKSFKTNVIVPTLYHVILHLNQKIVFLLQVQSCGSRQDGFVKACALGTFCSAKVWDYWKIGRFTLQMRSRKKAYESSPLHLWSHQNPANQKGASVV